MKKQIFLTIFLFLIFSIFLFTYLQERKINEPYKKTAEIIKNQILKSEKESLKLSSEGNLLSHPLEIEKEKKEKFGEALNDEKILFISEEILKNIDVKIKK